MWKTVKLGDVCELVGGGTPSKKNAAFYGGEIPWATVRDMHSDELQETELKITELGLNSSSSKVIPANNVVIASRVGLGKVCLLAQDTAINQDLRGVLPKAKNTIDARYLFYWFKSIEQTIISAGRGATVHGVTLPFLKKLELPLPPLPEQQRIVAKLDAAFAEIDRAIDVAESKYSEVEKLKAALLASALRGEDWDTVKLGEVCVRITDGSHNPPKGVENSSFLMLSSKNVFDDKINFDKPRYLSQNDFIQENKRTDIQQGDVLLTIVGTIGRCAVVENVSQPFTLQRSVAVLKPKPDKTDSRFLMYSLQGMLKELTSGARGVAQKGIYLKSLKELGIALPPLEQQQRIVAKLDAAFAEIDKSAESILRAKANYLALKSAILAQELQPPESKAA